MSLSTIHGLERYKLTMGPNFAPKRDEKGMWTATAEYRCISEDLDSTQIQAKLKRGTSVTSIADNTLSAQWNFLTLETYDARNEPGGITVIEVMLKGFTDDQWDFDEDASKVYTRNGATVEDSILNHPVFKQNVSNPQDIESFRMAMAGTWREREDSTASTIYVVSASGSDRILNTITDPDVYEWWTIVIRNGQHTYQVPTMEWTVSTTGKLPLTSSDFDKFGFIEDNVPGSPGTPADRDWLFTGVTENIQKTGEGSNSHSKTYTLSPKGGWPEKIYKKP